jgi:putative ABC transport system permease protein
MSLREALLVALRAVRAHRLRSTLTMLGLIIGVSAVVLLSACGQGVKNSVDARIEPVANNITIVSQAEAVPDGPPAQNLTDADAAALQGAPDIATVTPVVTSATTPATGATGSAPGAGTLIETDSVQFLSANIIGTTDIWATTNNRNLTAGSFFDAAQASSAARVVVLGPTVARTLFDDPAAALDQTVQIGHEPFRVTGVMASYGQQLDNTAVMPLSTARRYVFGYGTGSTSDQLDQIVVQAPQQTDVPAAMAEITRILDARHHITDPGLRDFQVQSLGSRLQTFNQIVRILVLFTPAVAALSLIVGGVGVLNIMLVSVTERTREIGIRKAIGATNRAILEQFLIESIVLAGLGGLIGVGIGVGLTFLIGAVAPAFDPSSGALAGFTPVLSVVPVAVALGISLAIGLIAGGYPAFRAAKLLPIQALRYQ